MYKEIDAAIKALTLFLLSMTMIRIVNKPDTLIFNSYEADGIVICTYIVLCIWFWGTLIYHISRIVGLLRGKLNSNFNASFNTSLACSTLLHSCVQLYRRLSPYFMIGTCGLTRFVL